jgi:spectinomycin phosphotransferase
VKTSTGPQRGLAVMALLAARGVAGVPAPLRSRGGDLTTGLDGVGLSVVPWVGERRALDGGLRPAQWAALGRLLAEVHATPIDGPLTALPRAGHDPARWVWAVRALEADLRAADPADPAVLALRDLWATHRHRVLAVADLAEACAGEAEAWRDAPVVVCHADPHLGNVQATDPDQVWLLDWDDAVLAQPEWDLMFVVGGVLATPTRAEQQAFAAAYGTWDPHPTRLRYAQSHRALEDFVDFAHDVLAVDRHPPAHRAWALEVLHGQVGPDGLVAFALGDR